ncbi:secreted RxLR effector protein 78-like [Nicotiana tabacum]|uniref:Secreted RxLR effector protein 78-like n=1 Tax=Nicotiana tabacum TaxID=4097 RepID=A0AC58SM69_TOBAC
MICTRLKPAVSHIVADNQSAFVQGRSMMHNVLICHDLLKHYNRKTTPRCLMKIDLRKAYDMVSWEFLEEALRGYGFPDKFIHWIMVCVSTTMFTIKVNGEGHGYFAGKRGLRQGDPISPLLFVIIMEHLSRTLKTISRLPYFRFYPICKEIKLTHLIFADDLMIF